MLQQLREIARRSTLVLTAGLLALASCVPAQAAEPASFQWAPADVSFYSSMLRNREQVEAIANSKAWARLMDVPIVKQYMGLAKGQLSDNPQMALVKQIMDQPENKELQQLLTDMVSDEVFLVGGESWGDFADLAGRLNTAYSYGPIKMLASGKVMLGMDPNKIQMKAVASALADNTKLIKIPDLLFGFKIPDSKKAENQLKRLEAVSNLLADQVPALKGKIKQVKIGTGTFLALTLDSSLVPWDEIPFSELDLEKDQLEKLVAALKQLTLHIHIGVSGDYVLLSLAGSPGLLGKLGGKGDKLGDREEFKPLARYKDNKLISVGYVSKALRQRSQADPTDYDSLIEMAKQLLDKADLDENHKKKILKDATDLLAEARKKPVPEVGAGLSFAFLTDKGQEAYTIEYGKYQDPANPKPLTLLNHLGGSPLIAVVSRSEPSEDGYDKGVKLLQMMYAHGDEIAKTKLMGDAKEQYIKVTRAALPLLKRLDEITRTLYLPALADGQLGLVIDAKWKSKQWIRAMPELPVELAMPEIGLLVGVSDADKLVKAIKGYAKLFEDAVDVARELSPDAQIQAIKIPPPQTLKKTAGTLYYYPLPEDFGLEDRVAPTAGLSATVGVLTLSHEYAERLLTEKPFQTRDTAFDTKRPLLSAAIFNWASIVDTLVPWAEFAAGSLVIAPEGQEAQAKAMLKAVTSQIRTIAEVVKVYKGTTTATYVEDGKLITRSVSIIRDLDK
jgi:hypothetical protein